MSKFQILLSCMNVADFSIVQKSHLENVDCLLINQCNTETDGFVQSGRHHMFNTSTRGLSVSRNLALQHSKADICLLSDDDEVFCPGLENTVLSAYNSYPDADVIIFKMTNYPTKLGNKARRLKKYDLLRVASWQISFKTSSVKGKIGFDTKLGAGTPNGAGEENKFLLDCHKAGLKIYYVPEEIASVAQVESTWFSGYNQKYFFNRGKTTRYILGLPISVLYAVHFLILKYKRYHKDISTWQAGRFLFKGIMAKDIDAKYE